VSPRIKCRFGPVHTTAGYGRENLPFDVENKAEVLVRAPIVYLPEIKSRTFVVEGSESGNISALRLMAEKNRNKKVHFLEVAGSNHFNILAPLNAMLAKKIMADSARECSLSVSADEVKAEMGPVAPNDKAETGK
jgi:hypothetical protein